MNPGMTFANWFTLAGVVLGAMTFIGGCMSWWLRLTLKAELASFRKELTKDFTDQFQDGKLAEARRESLIKDLQNVRDELARLHVRINDVEDYAHKNNHDVRNKVQVIELKCGELAALARNNSK